MKRYALTLLCMLVAGCASDEHQALREWMAEQTKGLKGNIPKLPEVRPYDPAPYAVEAIPDPFFSGKIDPTSGAQKNNGKRSPYQPDFEAREVRNSVLEKFPLESLRMIGYLNVERKPIALIQVDGKVRQVKVGEYMGLDFGLVTKISEQELTLRELVQDSAGDWSERVSSLQLQTKEGSKQ